jgi:hypothetical protein
LLIGAVALARAPFLQALRRRHIRAENRGFPGLPPPLNICNHCMISHGAHALAAF